MQGTPGKLRMRRAPLLPLLLSTALIPASCGRYRLDQDQQASAGGAMSGATATNGGSGTTAGGSAAVSEDAGSGGSALGGAAGDGGSAGAPEAEAGAAGDGGSAGSVAAVHDRWLASETFVSSASSQTELSLVDLTNPDAAPVVLDDTSGAVTAFSNDGRWLLYEARRDSHTADVYIVDLWRPQPFKPQLLLITGAGMPCKWAPDSSRVACIEDLGDAAVAERAVVFFDTSGAAPGSKTVIGEVLAKSAGSAGGAERELAFLDRDNLVYSYGPNDFARITWHGATPSPAQPLGLGGGTIAQEAPDGRLLLKRTDPNFPLGLVLADFRTGQATVIDSHVSLGVSATFGAAYSVNPPGAGETGPGIYIYYAINGTTLTQVGMDPADPARPTFSYDSTFVGQRLARMKGQRVFVVSIGATGVVDQEVPGAYANVNELEVDSTGTWLYIGSGEYDAQQQPIAATAKQWLSKLNTDGPAAAQLIAEGSSIGNVHFAPNGRGLVLSGYDTKSPTPVPFWLYDLNDPEHIAAHQLDIPLNWSDIGWSPDSSFVSFLGGAPGAQTRPLYVVNSNTPSAPPRLITACGNGSASPSPACPAVAVFQP